MRVYRIPKIRLMLAAAAVVWIVFFSPIRNFRITGVSPQDWRSRRIDDSEIRLCYPVKQDGWMTFDVAGCEDLLRIITNGHVDAAVVQGRDPLSRDLSWDYSIAHELLDGSGTVLGKGVTHFKSRITEYVDPLDASRHPGAFFMDREWLPTDGQILPLSLSGYPRPVAVLRLKAVTSHAALREVTVRVYRIKRVEDRELRYEWLRIPTRKKVSLATGNVYQPELLTDLEKKQLLLRQWSPLPPEGVAGRDYESLKMYVIQENTDTEILEPVLPAGLFLPSGRKGMIPIPDAGGHVRIVFLPRVQFPGTEGVAPVSIRWFGMRVTERSSAVVAWSGRTTRFSAPFGPGLVEVSPPQDAVVRAFLSTQEVVSISDRPEAGEAEITPQPVYVSPYLALPEKPLEYEILDGPAGLRVDLRSVSSGPEAGKGGRLKFELLGDHGSRVMEGELPVVSPLSSYDMSCPAPGGFRVTDPVSFYLAAPREATRLRMTAPEGTVLVQVYSRPSSPVRTSRIPEDYLPLTLNPQLQRAWFRIRAVDHDRLYREQRVVLLDVQTRPPADDIDVVQGRYDWTEYRPEGPWSARRLLVPRDAWVPDRPQLLSVLYREFPAGLNVVVRVSAPDDRAKVTPNLVFVGDVDGPLSLQVYVDGVRLAKVEMNDRTGEVILPAIDVGRHTLRIEPSRAVRLYINCLETGPTSVLLQRTGVQIDATGLVFEYRKKGKDSEILTAEFFSDTSSDNRSRIRVRFDAAPARSAGMYSSWTFADRIFDVKPGEGNEVLVLGAKNVRAGRPFFIPFGADLPAGAYRIRFEIESGENGYLVFSRVAAGESNERRFFLENDPGHD